MTIEIDITDDRSLSYQLKDALMQRIEGGLMPEGRRLEPERAMAERFKVSRDTVRHAIADLVRSGHLKRAARRGTFVSGRWRALRDDVVLKCRLYSAKRDDEIHGRAFDRFRGRYPRARLDTSDPGRLADQDVIRVWGSTANLQRELLLTIAEPMADSPAVRQLPEAAAKWFGGRDRLFALPVLYSGAMLFFHRARFEEAGLPCPDESWDWDALRRATKRLDDPASGRYGFYPHREMGRVLSFVWQNGGELFDSATGMCAASAPRVVEALAFYQDLVAAPLSNGAHLEDMEAALAQGRFAMCLWGGRMVSATARIDSQARIGVAPLPKGRCRATAFFGEAYAVCRASRRPDLSCALIEELAGPATLRELAASGDYVVADRLLQVRSNAAKVYLDALEYARQDTGAPDIEVQQLLSNEFADLTKGARAADVCRRAEQVVNSLLCARQIRLEAERG